LSRYHAFPPAAARPPPYSAGPLVHRGLQTSAPSLGTVVRDAGTRPLCFAKPQSTFVRLNHKRGQGNLVSSPARKLHEPLGRGLSRPPDFRRRIVLPLTLRRAGEGVGRAYPCSFRQTARDRRGRTQP